MRFKKLNVTSFGKIIDKEIKLKPGLNIILGGNESGKSTIRSFIFDLFFAGTLSGSSKTIYTKEHDKYIPWSSNRFEGSAIVENNGEDYQIYRNFHKGFEKLSIFNLKNGTDAKSIFYIDESKRVQKFSSEFFGVTENTLRDLFEITDDYFMRETLSYDLKERIINHFSTKSEDISIASVIENIQEYTFNKEIKKEAQLFKNQLSELERELSGLIDIYNNDDIFEKTIELDREIDNIKEDLEILEEELNYNLEANSKSLEENIEKNSILSKKIRIEQDILIREEELEESEIFKYVYLLLILPIIIGGISHYLLKIKYLTEISVGVFFAFIVVGFLYKFIKNKKVTRFREELKGLYYELDLILDELKYKKISKDDNFELNTRFLLDKINEKKDLLQEKALERELFFNEIKEIDLKLNKLNELNNKKEAIEARIEEINFKKNMGLKAIEIVNNLSKLKFEKISNSLIEDCSEFLKLITDDKYTRLLVNENNDIMLFDNKIKQLVNLDSLSKGTIGQVYLAYRLGLIVNSGIDFPIIIDDGFTLFDMRRNKNSLKLLKKLSSDYQILLFTSNNRDIENTTDVNIINLGS